MNNRKSNIDKNYKRNVYTTKKMEKRKSFCPAGTENLDHA
jgi:hypothetical protein